MHDQEAENNNALIYLDYSLTMTIR